MKSMPFDAFVKARFIGDEYKAARKILLSKLNGSSAFKSVVAKQKEVDEN